MGLEDKEIKRQDVPQEQEIDLIELAQYIWSKRMFLLKLCGITLVVGLIVAFSIPKEYTTTVKIAPELQNPDRGSGLSNLAAIAGININPPITGSDAILPTLYPDVVASSPFLVELFSIPVSDAKQKFDGTLYDYMLDHQRSAWWDYLIKAPFQVLAWVKSLFAEEVEGSGGLDPFRLTSEQKGVLEALKERIAVVMDQKTFAVTLSIQMQDPLISAQVTDVVLENLQKYITGYRTQKAKQDLVFTEKVFADAKADYYEAQQNYARFEDSNRNIATASHRTEQERLRNEMTIAFNVYNTLAQHLEQNKLKVQEQTPVYAVIEPATVPIGASSPRKLFILAGAILLGLFGGIGWLFIRNFIISKERSEHN